MWGCHSTTDKPDSGKVPLLGRVRLRRPSGLRVRQCRTSASDRYCDIGRAQRKCARSCFQRLQKGWFAARREQYRHEADMVRRPLRVRFQSKSGSLRDRQVPLMTRSRTLSAATLTWINGAHAVFIERLQAVRPSEPRSAQWAAVGWYHEEMARVVHSRGAAFAVRSLRSIQRRWPGPDGGAALHVPH